MLVRHSQPLQSNCDLADRPRMNSECCSDLAHSESCLRCLLSLLNSLCTITGKCIGPAQCCSAQLTTQPNANMFGITYTLPQMHVALQVLLSCNRHLQTKHENMPGPSNGTLLPSLTILRQIGQLLSSCLAKIWCCGHMAMAPGNASKMFVRTGTLSLRRTV